MAVNSGLGDVMGGNIEKELIVVDSKRKRIELEDNQENIKGGGGFGG